MQLPEFLKKNSFVLGVVMGIVLPMGFYMVLWFLDIAFLQVFGKRMTRAPHLLYLLSMVVNLFPIRYYLVKLKLEKSGLGLLAVTAILILTYLFQFFNQ
ncbi:MAG: hypothetical protein L3J31_01840 [Bacteroidales bacterium]|nr:hypothetical protein [Bacteroidales bacterium]